MQSHACAYLDKPAGDQCRCDEHCQYKLFPATYDPAGPVFCGKDQITTMTARNNDSAQLLSIYAGVDVMDAPRQPEEMCVICDEPTGRCGEDSLHSKLLDDEEIGPLCEDCFEMFEKTRLQLAKSGGDA